MQPFKRLALAAASACALLIAAPIVAQTSPSKSQEQLDFETELSAELDKLSDEELAATAAEFHRLNSTLEPVAKSGQTTSLSSSSTLQPASALSRSPDRKAKEDLWTECDDMASASVIEAAGMLLTEPGDTSSDILDYQRKSCAILQDGYDEIIAYNCPREIADSIQLAWESALHSLPDDEFGDPPDFCD